eukprot:TRINITY_DN3892_c0_g1_i1.p1 TRINITY_DN3892_c0_g1~~TRINITY_DN3892_c0_g1_i1.p1  ORF type:complete len:404 (-),score=69.68 TRINITY_DN3892_c0_g1_i1:154-1344(-)
MGKGNSKQKRSKDKEKDERTKHTHDISSGDTKLSSSLDKHQQAVQEQAEELENADLSLCFSRNKEKVTKDDFELLTVIGKGSFGKVMQVKKKDSGKIYAMKVLRKQAIIEKKQVIHTKAEKSILQKIQHPFIVSLIYAFQTEEKLYMVLEYVNGGELFFHLKREGKFAESRVRLYAAEISSALIHLHSLDIVYRDLKPENILLDCDGHICITDFGLSKEIAPTEGSTHSFCGTPEYLAPEVLRGQGHSTPVDWWSLGILIYEMLTGLPPFYSRNQNQMYQKILTETLKFPPYVSPEAQSLLRGLLDRDVSTRLGDAKLKQHPFFASIDWVKLDAKEVETPYKPHVVSEEDISQIDPVFTRETAIDSVVEKSVLSNVDGDMNFENFTYTAPTVLKGL